MYKVSKSVTEGCIVSLRGDKFIRCSSKAKPFGIWELGSTRVTILLNGERSKIELPAGVIVYGKVWANLEGSNANKT